MNIIKFYFRRHERRLKIKRLLKKITIEPNTSLNLDDHPYVINCLNAYSLAEATQDEFFYQALMQSDILLCDGILVQFLCLLYNRRSVKRAPGPDYADALFWHFHSIGGARLLYYGSTKEVCLKLQNKLKLRHSRNVIVAKSAPFFKFVEPSACDDLQQKIQAMNANVVFTSMTAPKQEKLAYFAKQSNKNLIFVQVGAYFEFVAGTVKRSPRILRLIGMEWFWRLIIEPRKLVYRIWTMRFLF